MKQTKINFKTNIEDIESLLELSLSITNIEQKKVIFRSAVVLLIASWEQYIEQLANSSVLVLTNRLRDSSTLPENVKQSIANFAISEKRNNLRDFSDSVWLFADKGWKNAYFNYCEELTTNFHTASPNNVKDLYWKLLGIRDLARNWCYSGIGSTQCVENLNDLINLRHDIAHGSITRVDEITQDYISENLIFLLTIAEKTYEAIIDRTAELSHTQAIEYSLAQTCLINIILYASKKADGVLSLDEIKTLGSSAQGNHNKLRYEPWALLEEVDRKTRKISERLIQFHNNEITLPLEILVFDNNESIPKPSTRYVTFLELQSI